MIKPCSCVPFNIFQDIKVFFLCHSLRTKGICLQPQRTKTQESKLTSLLAVAPVRLPMCNFSLQLTTVMNQSKGFAVSVGAPEVNMERNELKLFDLWWSLGELVKSSPLTAVKPKGTLTSDQIGCLISENHLNNCLE